MLFWRRVCETLWNFGAIPILSQHHQGMRQAISLPCLLSVHIQITDTAHKLLLFLFEALLVLPAFSPSSDSKFQKFNVCSVNEYFLIWLKVIHECHGVSSNSSSVILTGEVPHIQVIHCLYDFVDVSYHSPALSFPHQSHTLLNPSAKTTALTT